MKIRVRMGPSRSAGQGLFAAQDIKQGTKIILDIGERITQEESERRLAAGNPYIFGLDERYSIDSPPYTFSLLNGDIELNRDGQLFV